MIRTARPTGTDIETPFDRFVEPAARRPALWRLGLGLVLAAFVYLGLNALAFAAVAMAAGPDAAQSFGAKLSVASTPASALLLLATFVPMVVAVVVAARVLHGRGPLTLFGPMRRGLRDTLLGVGVTLAVYLPLIAVWEAGFDSEPNLPAGLWLALLPLGITALGIQTLAEELVFRGYLTQQLAARFHHPWIWAALPALAFALLHLDPGAPSGGAALTAAGAFVFGLAAADLTARTGSIGLAWGVHLANNAVAVLGLATQGTITGLALRVTPYGIDEVATAPGTAVLELAPFLLVWFILRRLTPG